MVPTPHPCAVGQVFQVCLPVLGAQAHGLTGDTVAPTVPDRTEDLLVPPPLQVILHSSVPSRERNGRFPMHLSIDAFLLEC